MSPMHAAIASLVVKRRRNVWELATPTLLGETTPSDVSSSEDFTYLTAGRPELNS